MAKLTYHWTIPDRPAFFYASAATTFELELALPDERYQACRASNLDEQQPFADRLDQLVIASPRDAGDVFQPLLRQLHDLYEARVATPAAVRQVDLVAYLLAFVQHFPYAADEDTTGRVEYARYPLETLHDQTGDCECLALLLAALLYHAALANVALLSLPGHVAVGVADDLDRSLGGAAAVEHDGRRYVYCETTAPGWRVGDLPPEYRDAPVTVYPLA